MVHTTPGDAERKAVIATNAAQALQRLKSNQTYEDWRQVGAQLLIITEETLNDLGLGAWDKDDKKLVREFTQRFEQWERTVGDNAKPLSKQERWALRTLMTEPKYHAWYTTLPGPKQRDMNHPNAIINAYKRRHPEPKAPGQERRKTAKELQAAFQRGLDAVTDVLQHEDGDVDHVVSQIEQLLSSVRSVLQKTVERDDAELRGTIVERLQTLAQEFTAKPDAPPPARKPGRATKTKTAAKPKAAAKTKAKAGKKGATLASVEKELNIALFGKR